MPRETEANDKRGNVEVDGGGFFVFQCSDKFDRVGLLDGVKKFYYSFKYATLGEAQKEGARLARLHPDETFYIFHQSQLSPITVAKEEN